MKLNGFAEFVGYWVQGWYPLDILTFQTKTEKFGVFRMFIDSREDLGNSAQEISGRIKDKLGKSTFHGIITPQKIKFVKIYTPGYSDKSVEGFNSTYRGVLSPKIYHGKRHYHGDYWFFNRRGRRLRDIPKFKFKGKFLLERHCPSRTLEFLMRMDY